MTLWEAWSLAPAELTRLLDLWRSDPGQVALLQALIALLILMLTGGGAELLYWTHAAGMRRAAIVAQPATRAEALLRGLERAGIDALAALISAGTMLAVLEVATWPEAVEQAAGTLILAVTLLRLGLIAAILLLSPSPPRLRVLPLTDLRAIRLQRRIALALWIPALEAVALALILPLSAALAQLAIPVFAVIGVVAALRAVALLPAPPVPGTRRPASAALLPLLLGLGIIATGLLRLSGETAAFLTMGVLTWGFALERLAETVVRSVWPQDPAHPLAAYQPMLRRALRVILALAGAWIIAAVWGLDPSRAQPDDGAIVRLLRAGLSVAVVLLLADLAWVAIRTAIDRAMMAGDGGNRSARVQTLLPLLRRTVALIILTLVVLIVLANLGLDIAPLIAGAGFVGLALGFGAQTLVRDIVSGIFFLLEDAFRVGEYIEAGEWRGTVEAISLRSLRLRHHRGAVHTIPFGEIKSLTNHSRDWVIVKLEVHVPYDVDPGVIKKIVKQIGQDVAADPELGPALIEAPKSQGVVRMTEHFMVMRVKFMARPDERQFIIRRELYHRVRARFEERGIRLGDRAVRVVVAQGQPEPDAAGGQPLPAPDLRQAAAAASAA